MRESLLLTLRTLMRGRVLFLLLGAVGLVHWLMPDFVRSDGSASGAFEMHVRAVPGVVAAIVQLAVLSIACGLFAHEREQKRLALTLSRPVSAFAVAVGRWLGVSVIAACALMFSSALLLAFPPDMGNAPLPSCRHHYAPSLPPPEVSAGRILASYLEDPATPETIKKASRRAVLTLLTTKELDRYDVIKPGDKMTWPFDIGSLKDRMVAGEPLSLRVRFSTQFEMRTPVAGEISVGDYVAVVSNNTQALIEIPLVRVGAHGAEGPLGLTFANTGTTAVMIRPRRDLEVLAPADSFWWNLFRAQIEVVSLSMLLVAFGLFLSAALSRPVAVFTALASFAVVLMVPSVIVQFPDEFNAPLSDRIGLALSRCVQTVTASVSGPSPMSDLATGRAVEWIPMLRTVAWNSVLLPCVLLALSAFIVRRKPLADV